MAINFIRKYGLSTCLVLCLGLVANAQLICFDYPADTFSAPPVPTSVTAADFNGDGFDDLALCHYWGYNITIMMNDGNGNFPGIITYDIDWPYYGRGKIIAADVDNDDILDLILLGMFYDIHIFIGTGTGNFTQIASIWTDYWSRDGIAGFFDADSNIDLALICPYEDNLRILPGNGSGYFQSTNTYSLAGTVPLKMDKADFNDDGYTDIVVCNHGTETFWYYNIVMFLGTGQGTFQPGQIVNDQYIPESIVAGDFNNDRKDDIIFKRYDRWLVKLWGNGDGTFQEPDVQEIWTPYYAVYLHKVDINLDNYTDLAMGGGAFNMYINDGTGFFEDTANINHGSNNNSVTEIAIGNFNGDAKPDIVSTHRQELESDYGSVTVFLNCLPVNVPGNESMDDPVIIYPNPNNGMFRVSSSPNGTSLKVSCIFDCLGNILESKRYSCSGDILDLTGLNPGIYILQFTDGNKIISKKVLIQR